MMKNGEKYLVTTEGWFYGPDAQIYRAVWGKIEIVTTQQALGFNPARSTNWFLKVGDGNNSILVAGCQINYAIRCEEKPLIKTELIPDKETGLLQAANCIFIAI